MMHSAIAMVEFSGIAKGMEVTDLMLKSAEVTLLMGKTVCPGKYVVMVGGDVAAAQRALQVGIEKGGVQVVDEFLLSNIHPDVLPAIGGVTDVNVRQAIGVVETFNVATCIEAADFALKAAGVTLIRLHMAYGIGGKCYFVMSGNVADVEIAKNAASQVACDKGALVYSMVLANPDPDFWQQLVVG